MSSRTIMITGGAGFIGSNLVRYLRRERPNWKIVNLDKLTYAGNYESLVDLENDPKHRFVLGDIGDTKAVTRLLQEQQVHTIINLAAESHVDRSISDPRVFLEANVLGAHSLLEAARRASVRRFVQVSTDEVYGSLSKGDAPFTEASPLKPSSPYSASKASADLIALSYHHTYGLDVVVTRCTNNYGPYQFPEKLIPLMISNAIEGKKLPVYGDGMQVRDWIHVDDHCSAILAALENGRAGEVYNIGSNNEWTNIDIVKRILELTGKPESLIEHVKDRLGHDRRYAVDASKAFRELKWVPESSGYNSLVSTVSWYINNWSWVQNAKKKV